MTGRFRPRNEPPVKLSDQQLMTLSTVKLAASALGRSWLTSDEVTAAWNGRYVWEPGKEVLASAMRQRLHRLADWGLLNRSPRGKPPGTWGLLFRLNAAGLRRMEVG